MSTIYILPRDDDYWYIKISKMNGLRRKVSPMGSLEFTP